MQDIDKQIKNIESEILSLKEKYNRTRNVVEKATYSSKIDNLRLEIGKLEKSKSETQAKEVINTNAPTIADHVESDDEPVVQKQLITDTGKTFITTI